MKATMKTVLVAAFALVAMAQNLPSFSQSIQNIPDCSRSAFKDAMNKEGCSTSDITTSTFSCLCNQHLQSIAYDTGTELSNDVSCASDFGNAFGTMCGIYIADASDSEVSAGVSDLSNVVGGTDATKTGLAAGKPAAAVLGVFAPAVVAALLLA